MEYIYAALLLHKAGKKVEESAVTKVLEAAGVKADAARVKALIASLEGVNIDAAIEKAAMPVAAAAPPAAADTGKEQVKTEDEQKKAEESKKSEEKAAAGLGSLFG